VVSFLPASSSPQVFAVSVAGVEVAAPASRQREEACVVVADAHWAASSAAAEEARSGWARVRADYFRAVPIPGGCLVEPPVAGFPAALADCWAEPPVAGFLAAQAGCWAELRVAGFQAGSSPLADCLADSAERDWVQPPVDDCLVGSYREDDWPAVPDDCLAGSSLVADCLADSAAGGWVPLRVADYLAERPDWLAVPDDCSVGSLPVADYLVEQPQEDDWRAVRDDCSVDSPRVGGCWAARQADDSPVAGCSVGWPHRGAHLAPADFRGDSQAGLPAVQEQADLDDWPALRRQVVPGVRHYLRAGCSDVPWSASRVSPEAPLLPWDALRRLVAGSPVRAWAKAVQDALPSPAAA
jgi:hypothetical protein